LGFVEKFRVNGEGQVTIATLPDANLLEDDRMRVRKGHAQHGDQVSRRLGDVIPSERSPMIEELEIDQLDRHSEDLLV